MSCDKFIKKSSSESETERFAEVGSECVPETGAISGGQQTSEVTCPWWTLTL